jgi:hypothetical protein
LGHFKCLSPYPAIGALGTYLLSKPTFGGQRFTTAIDFRDQRIDQLLIGAGPRVGNKLFCATSMIAKLAAGTQLPSCRFPAGRIGYRIPEELQSCANLMLKSRHG